MIVRTPIGEFSVFRITNNIEKDIPVRRVRILAINELTDELDDFIHVLGRTRHLGDLVHSHFKQIGAVIRSHLRSNLSHWDLPLLCLSNQLVINVGDIDDPFDLKPTVGQISCDGIEDYRPHHVTNMCLFVNGWPTQIDAHFAGLHRHECLLGPTQCVVNSDRLYGHFQDG